MATKKVNEAKATAWTKTMRMDMSGSISGVATELFGLIDSPVTREKALAIMQDRHKDLLEWEAQKEAENGKA